MVLNIHPAWGWTYRLKIDQGKHFEMDHAVSRRESENRMAFLAVLVDNFRCFAELLEDVKLSLDEPSHRRDKGGGPMGFWLVEEPES
jgi:hypothetical protein